MVFIPGSNRSLPTLAADTGANSYATAGRGIIDVATSASIVIISVHIVLYSCQANGFAASFKYRTPFSRYRL